MSTAELHKIAKWDQNAVEALLERERRHELHQRVRETEVAYRFWEKVVVWIILFGAMAVAGIMFAGIV